MGSSYSILYELQTRGISELDRLVAAQKNVSIEAKYSQTVLREVEEAVKRNITAGGTYANSLKEVAGRTTEYTRSASNLAKELLATDRAQQQVGNSAQGTAMKFRLASQEIGVSMPRALTSLMAKSAAASAVMNAMFPAIAAVGFAEVLVHVAEKVIEIHRAFDDGYNAMERYLTEAPKLAREFRGALESVNSEILKTQGLNYGPAYERRSRQLDARLSAQSASQMAQDRRDQIARLTNGPQAKPVSQGDIMRLRDEAEVYESQARMYSLQATNFGKEADQTQRTQDRPGENLADQVRRQVAAFNDRGEKDPIQKIAEQYQNDIAEDTKRFKEEKRPTGDIKGMTREVGNAAFRAMAKVIADTKAKFLREMDEAGIEGAAMSEKMAEEHPSKSASALPWGGSLPGMPSAAAPALGQGTAQERTSMQMMAMRSRGNTAMIGSDDRGAAAALNAEVERQIVDLTLKEAAAQLQIEDTLKNRAELDRATFEARKQGLEIELELEKQIAEIKKQQDAENKSFYVGLMNAGIQGGRAPADYMRNFGRKQLDTIAGNFSSAFLPKMQAFSLGNTGVLGTAKNPNILGKLLAGTPLGFNPKDEAQKALITSQDALRASVDALTATMGGTPPSGSVAGIPTGIPGLGNFPNLGGFGTGTTPPFLPSGTASSGGGGGFSWPGASSIGGDILTKLPSGLILRVPSGGGGSDSGGGLDGMGLPTFDGMGGYSGQSDAGGGGDIGTDSAPWSGTPDFSTTVYGSSDGSGDGDSGGGTSASGAASVANVGISDANTIMSGISSAKRAFKNGTAAGKWQGTSAVLGTAAAVDPEPISKAILAIGAMATGIIASLKMKGPEQRQTNESKSLMAQDFVQGAAHNYQLGNDSSMGADYSAAGVARQGGATSNVHVYVQAMDARSFQEYLGNNPTALGAGMLNAFSNSGLQGLSQIQSYAAANGGF